MSHYRHCRHHHHHHHHQSPPLPPSSSSPSSFENFTYANNVFKSNPSLSFTSSSSSNPQGSPPTSCAIFVLTDWPLALSVCACVCGQPPTVCALLCDQSHPVPTVCALVCGQSSTVYALVCNHPPCVHGYTVSYPLCMRGCMHCLSIAV